ncbi:hypothetical protein GE061_004341 [Apolygus lucorum]|uniref:SOWAHA-C winged helix-turn-helix domain-containing protein n=1 Tax=Apolygus lucorum TaxID=248454 RepID=A0A8S9X2X1_APOLU|nr:hypothetical protein GE061_004341 [Apolygus lucorum]
MSEPTSFTQEAIRDFMIFRGGKVTNHELVKHFKKFLTNPGTQEEARVLFKEYVNNLATITRDPDGGKQLVLKKRYRTPSIDQSFNTSGLPPTPLSPTETPNLNLRYQPVYQSSFELDVGSPHRSPYRRLSSESLTSSYSLRSPGTPTSPYQLTSPAFPPSGSSVGYQQIVTPLGYSAPPYHTSAIPSSPQHLVPSEPPIGIPSGPVQPLGLPSQPTRMVPLTPVPLGMQNPSPSLPSIPTSLSGSSSSSGLPLGIPQSSSVSNISSSGHNQQYKSNSPIASQDFRQSTPRRRSSNDSVFTDSGLPPKEQDPPPVPPRRRSSDKSLTKMDLRDLEDFKPKESPGTPMSIQSGASTPTLTATPVDQKPDDNKENVVEDSKISVKERMQKFDRMASESALLSKNTSSLNTNLYKKRQEKLDRDEEDTGSVTLIDAKTREWLVKCAQADYQGMVKMAAENPKLVKFKVCIFTVLPIENG